jgi:hypothetical protein
VLCAVVDVGHSRDEERLSSSCEQPTSPEDIQFVESKGWFNMLKNHWQPYLIKCTGVDSDILTVIAVTGCYSKEQAVLNTHSF